MPKPNLTILDSPSVDELKSTFYTNAGLIWAAQRVREVKSTPPDLANRTYTDICHACKELLQARISETGFTHSAGLVALNASAMHCDACVLVLLSLGGYRPLETWDQRAQALKTNGDDGDDEEDDESRSYAEKIRQGENDPDEVMIFEVPWDSDIELNQRRIRAVWRKQGVVNFQFPGDLVGFARLEDAGPAARSLWSSQNSEDWISRFDVLREWMEKCCNQHAYCSSYGVSYLPSRVVDLGDPDNIRLVVATGQIGTYTALSYCWGDIHVGITTTENLATRLQRLDLKELPLTFRDAAEVTQKLNIRYLWIDALCIIQDDPEDWQQESAKMHMIYSNATVTLSAYSAANCHEGLLLPFKPALHDDENTVHGKVAFRIGYIHSRSPAFPLSTRGWTLQEACLSQRIIHFTSRQALWQCPLATLSEDGLLDGEDDVLMRELPPMVRSLDLANPLSHSQWYDAWKRLAEIFSKRSFTYDQDKLSALAGIISLFRQKLADEPLIGLWERDVTNGLLWKSRSNKPSQLLPKMPSWSWLATVYEIEYDSLWINLGGDNYELVSQIELLSTSISWTGLPLVSELNEATLRVRGHVLRVFTGPPPSPTETWFNIVMSESSTQHAQRVYSDFEMDTLPSEVWCLGVATIERDESSALHGSKVVLVLTLVEAGSRTFRRVGLFVAHYTGNGHTLCTGLQCAPKETIVLI